MNNIEFHSVTKEYKNRIKALDTVSFSIESGVFGLLGHNGAGKTTLMKLLATIMQPTSGTISVCGFDTQKNGKEVRRLIGYLPQELNMYPSLSVFDFVSYMASLKGVKDQKQIKSILEQVDMEQYSKRLIGQLSGGMKRRVGIAQALVGNPEILIVDEPTAGLDPEERVRFAEFFPVSPKTENVCCFLLISLKTFTSFANNLQYCGKENYFSAAIPFIYFLKLLEK